MFDAEGGTTTDCKNRVRLAWNKWRQVTGVICDKKVPVKLKHKIYKTVIRPTMTYGAECWTMKKKDEMMMNNTEMRMLRWIQGVSLREHTRNEEIREAATVQPIATHLMQKRLRWYGHVRRSDECHTTRTVLDMVVEGVRPRGSQKLRYMDTIRRDIKKNALTDVANHTTGCFISLCHVCFNPYQIREYVYDFFIMQICRTVAYLLVCVCAFLHYFW